MPKVRAERLFTPSTPIKELWADAIHTKPVHADWQDGYGERWNYFEAQECEECHKVLCVEGGDGHCFLEETDCKGHVGTSEGPMMNYYYPLPDEVEDPQAAAAHIVNLPLCLVHFEDADVWALALTGGGMDLSWEICEAFMRLGYLPPLHFADLPGMAGKPKGARDAWVIAGCRRSAMVAIHRARCTLRKLRELKKRD